MKKIRTDIILVVGLLLVALVSWILIDNFVLFKGNTVEVLVEDTVVKSFPLDIDDSYTIEIDNYVNEVVVEDGSVYMKDANCRDLLCVKQGKITEGGQTIICLPHKLVVRIVSKENINIDAISN